MALDKPARIIQTQLVRNVTIFWWNSNLPVVWQVFRHPCSEESSQSHPTTSSLPSAPYLRKEPLAFGNPVCLTIHSWPSLRRLLLRVPWAWQFSAYQTLLLYILLRDMPVPGQRNYLPSISVYVKLSYKYLYRQDNIEVPAHQRALVIASVSIYFSTLNLNVSVENSSMMSIVCLPPELSIASQPTNHYVFPRSLQFPSAVSKILSLFKPHPLFPYSKSCFWFPVLWTNDSS